MCTRDLRYNDVACKREPLHICRACHKLEEDGRILGLTGCIAMFSRVGHGRTSTSLSYIARSEGPAKPQGHFRSLCLLAAMPGQPTLRATSCSHARTCTKQSLALGLHQVDILLARSMQDRSPLKPLEWVRVRSGRLRRCSLANVQIAFPGHVAWASRSQTIPCCSKHRQ